MTKDYVRSPYTECYDSYRLDFSKGYATRLRLWLGRFDAWLNQFNFDEQGINGLKLACAVILVLSGWYAASEIIPKLF